jgi:hypothetical protein
MDLANMREDNQLSMENTMPLERLAEQPFPIDLQGVGFWMRDVDDGRTVRCLLTQEALADVLSGLTYGRTGKSSRSGRRS